MSFRGNGLHAVLGISINITVPVMRKFREFPNLDCGQLTVCSSPCVLWQSCKTGMVSEGWRDTKPHCLQKGRLSQMALRSSCTLFGIPAMRQAEPRKEGGRHTEEGRPHLSAQKAPFPATSYLEERKQREKRKFNEKTRITTLLRITSRVGRNID